MKLYTTALLCLLLSCFGAVHAIGLDEDARNARAEHSTLAIEQLRLDTDFSKEEIECYKKFAVNSCLDTVSSRRRKALILLKNEESFRNDAERKARGAQQIRKTEEKSLPENSQKSIDQQTKSTGEYRGLAERQKETSSRLRTAAENEASAGDAFKKKHLANQEKIQARTEKTMDASEKAKKFKERQDDSLERRLRHEAEKTKQNKSPSKSLPLPDQ